MVGGIASHFQNLCRGIEEVSASDARFRDLEVDVFHGPAGVPYRSNRFSYQELGRGFGRFGADARFGLLHSGRYDAALFPNYFRPPIVRAGRSVVVIHDLLYKHMPELVSWQKRAWLDWAERYALRHCDQVIAISETVRQDLLTWFGQQWANKVRALGNPIAFERLDGDATSSVAGGRPYLLAVAVDRPFKNLHTLIHAFARLRPRFPEHRLVLAGELRSRRPKGRIHAKSVAAAAPPTVDLVGQLGLEDHVTITGIVSDQELGALYRGAEAFVLPSLFEGFGMPAVESLALGTPTIVSDIPVLREATLDLARYLGQPRDPAAVAEVVAAILENPAAARPSAESMAKIRRQFSPAAIAVQYLETLFGEPRLSAAEPSQSSARPLALHE
jgi:glycosyltransferase involved in cell wall biosynthesis